LTSLKRLIALLLHRRHRLEATKRQIVLRHHYYRRQQLKRELQ
jgi:hypothetical protein